MGQANFIGPNQIEVEQAALHPATTDLVGTENDSSITIISPNGGEIWAVDSLQTIRWNTFNLAGNIGLEISNDAGTTWSIITANTPNVGVFVWRPTSDFISDSCLIKASSVADNSVFDQSDSVFSVLMKCDVNFDGVVNEIDIQFIVEIVLGEIEPSPTQSWAADYNDDNSIDVGDVQVAYIEFLKRAKLRITSPNGGEVWPIAVSQFISWDPSIVSSNLKIEIFTNAGNSWAIIDSNIVNTSPYSWTPTLIHASDSCLIRITSLYDKSIFDQSDAMFSITTNNPPAVRDTIPNQILTVGGLSFTRNLNASPAVFTDPDGDILTFEVNSNADSIATAHLSGNILTVVPVAIGNAIITVIANDGKRGTVQTTFTVTVITGNQPPSVENPIPTQTLAVGGVSFIRDLNASPAVFTDPNGDVLIYSDSSSAPTIATANISGSTLTVAPVAVGSATITIKAKDGKGGTTSMAFDVEVVLDNQSPLVRNPIPDQNLALGGSVFRRDLNVAPAVFNDLDGDSLTYTTMSFDPTIAAANLSGSTLTVVPVKEDSTTITVTAEDVRGLTAIDTFIVVVKSGNLPPVVITPIPDQPFSVGGNSFTRDLNAQPAVFSDPNGDRIKYEASSSAPTVAAANISGSILTVVPVAIGSATVTVTANDGKGSMISTTFNVTVVRGNQPPIVVNKIPDMTLVLGDAEFARDLNSSPIVFSDPDGDALIYKDSSSAATIVATSLSASLLSLSPETVGNTTITITASDGKGGTTSTTFNVRVRCGPMLITNTPPSSQEMGKEIAIDANMSNNCGIAGATLYYRQGGEISFTPLPMSPTGNLYHGIIPASVATSQGVEYYIVGTDAAEDNTRWPSSGIISVQVIVPEPGVTKGSMQPSGSEQTAYRLISTPIDLDNKSARAVLEDDLGPYDIYKWRCYEVGASQKRSEFPDISDMTPGKAIWLIVKDEGKVIDTGAGRSNITSKEFSIALHPKWNLVANPFNFAVPVSKLRLQSSGQAPELRSYTGSWNNPITEKIAVMQPFQGYAVLNELTSVDTLFVNPYLSSSGNPLLKQITSRSQSTFLWSIEFRPDASKHEMATTSLQWLTKPPKSGMKWIILSRPSLANMFRSIFLIRSGDK